MAAASGGANGGSVVVVDRRLFPLTSLSIGIWALRRTRKSFLMILPEASMFVLLVMRDNDPKNKGHIGSRIAKHVDHLLRDKNPFVDHCETPELDASVLSFEVAWSSVVGVDYKHYLVQDARLVLEAKHVVKRVFGTIEEASAYYGSITATGDSGAADTAPGQVDTPTSDAVSPHKAKAGKQAGSGDRVFGGQADTAQRQHIGLSRASTLPALLPEDTTATVSTSGQPRKHLANGASAAPQQSSKQLVNLCSNGSHSTYAKARRGDGGSEAESSRDRRELGDSPLAPSTPSALAAAQALLRGAQLAAMAGGAAGVGSGWGVAVAAAAAGQGRQSDGSLAGSMELHQQLPTGSFGTASAQGISGNGSAAAVPGTAAETSAGRPAVGRSVSLLSAVSITTLVRPEQQQLSTGASRLSNGASLSASQLLEACREESTGQHQLTGSSPSTSPRATSQAGSNSSSSGSSSSSSSRSPRRSRSRSLSLAPIRTRLPSEEPTLPLNQQHSPAAAGDANCDSAWASPISGMSSPGAPSGASSPMLLLSPGAVTQVCAHSAPTSPKGAVMCTRGHGSFRFMATRSAGHGFASVPGSPAKHGSLGSAAGHGVLRASAPMTSWHQHSVPEQGMWQQQQQQQRQGHANGHHQVHLSVTGVGSGFPPQQHSHQVQQQQHAAFGVSTDAATTRTSCCPLCHQPLVLPKSWHQQQKEQQQQQQWRLRGLDLAADLPPRSGSACSLQQLCLTDGAAARRLSGEGITTTAAVRADGSSIGYGHARGSVDGLYQQGVGGLAGFGQQGLQQQQQLNGAAGIKQQLNGQVGVARRRQVPASAPVSPTQGQSFKQAGQGKQGSVSTLQLAAALAEGQGGDVAERAADATYSCRTLVLTFTDPLLPALLGKFVKSNMRLLKLYESGLPSWAVFLPSYGLWYRPWLRRVTWLLFILVSVLSMVLGFYDLYKNVPYLKQFIVRTFLPASSIFEWLESHTQIRLSILLTYLFGKSPLLGSLLRILTNTARVISAALQPLADATSRLLLPLQLLLLSSWQQVLWAVSPLTTAAALLTQQVALLATQLQWAGTTLFGPPARLIWLLGASLYQLLWLLLAGPLQLLLLLRDTLLLPAQYLPSISAGIKSVWSAVSMTGRAAKTSAPVVVNTARVARRGGWLMSALPLEALELMRSSAMSFWRAMQAILRFFTTLAVTINQHRLSLLLQLRQQCRALSQRCWATPIGRVVWYITERILQQRRRREAEAAAQLAAAALAAAAAGLAASGLDGRRAEGMAGGVFGEGYSDGVEVSVVAAAAAVTAAAGGSPGQLQDGFYAPAAQLLSAPGSPTGNGLADHALAQFDGAAMQQPYSADAQSLRLRAAAVSGAAADAHAGAGQFVQGQMEPCYCPDCLAAAAMQQAAQWQAAGEAVLALGSDAPAAMHVKAE